MSRNLLPPKQIAKHFDCGTPTLRAVGPLREDEDERTIANPSAPQVKPEDMRDFFLFCHRLRIETEVRLVRLALSSHQGRTCHQMMRVRDPRVLETIRL